jgi:hypothetical protein
MAEIVELLPDFPGFAVKYDLSKNPFFRPIIVENLRKLTTVTVGKSLLSSISVAAPRSRGDFLPTVNVLCMPTQINFTQSGFKREVTYGDGGSQTITGMSPTAQPQFSPQGCPFWMSGGSSCEAVDQQAADNGTGTVCRMRFSNVQIMTSKGEKADPYIVLAHELIHSLHCLEGIRANQDEELWTTGIGKYSNNPMSENAFRSQFGLPRRNKYYA